MRCEDIPVGSKSSETHSQVTATATKDRLALLRAHQEAWRTLSWSGVRGFKSDLTEWEMDGAVLACFWNANDIELKLVRSEMKAQEGAGKSMTRKYRIDGELRAHVHGWDAAQDLLLVTRWLPDGCACLFAFCLVFLKVNRWGADSYMWCRWQGSETL